MPTIAREANDTMRLSDSETIGMDLLLDGIHRRYGYDFSHYSHASLKRRLHRLMGQEKLARFTELLDKVLHDEKCFDHLLENMSVTVTEMFRDAAFFKAVREEVIPVLKTFPFVKIWHAGSATGEEVYSMAIMLHEEGFLDRARIYATDFNKHSLEIAQNGVYPVNRVLSYAANYREAGGTRNFSTYYSDCYGLAKFKDVLKDRITFSYHNLVTDGVFGEMNVIFCRNVLIYFDKTLQDQVLLKFEESLRHGGFLCLGNKESLNYTAIDSRFEAANKKQRIYRKAGARHV